MYMNDFVDIYMVFLKDYSVYGEDNFKLFTKKAKYEKNNDVYVLIDENDEFEDFPYELLVNNFNSVEEILDCDEIVLDFVGYAGKNLICYSLDECNAQNRILNFKINVLEKEENLIYRQKINLTNMIKDI